MAQAPLPIDGIADRSTYTDSVSFRVPTTGGYAYQVLFNGQPVPTDVYHGVSRMDYHEVFVSRTNTATLEVSNRLVRFIVLSSSRGDPEKGLIKWTPYPPIPSTDAEFAGARLRITAPQEYPMGLPIPVVAWVDDSQGRERRANGFVTAAGFDGQDVRIVRGVGSGFLTPATSAGTLSYDARLHSLSDPKQIQIEPTTAWTVVSGNLPGETTWPENSRIHITGGIIIPADSVLTVGAGTIVKLNPLANITNTGRCVINGTAARPVVFTATNVVYPERNAGAWGGFVMRGASSVLEANGAIFAGGGGATSWDFGSGSSHKSQQPVLFFHSNSVVRLTNCAVLNSAGQMGNGYNSDLTLDHTLWQRAITGGEYVGGTIIVNHSAILEFPAIDGVYDATIVDADYDGIYFTLGTHILRDSLFGFAKDDAIDSGSGGAGTVWVTNCWVESALHEAHAWSGSGRVASSYDIVLMNSGQGLECGWSSSDGSPNVFAERMLSVGNSIGARFGDNYDWDYWGSLRVTNSLILNNHRDIWGMNWDNWLYGIYTPTGPFRMDLQGNFVTQPNTNHPNNALWDPARDGWRLAHWMTTPPDAPVGIGLALWSNQLTAEDLTNGVPVRLSSFTTNFVSVDYELINSGGTFQSGTLQFAPGETLKRLPRYWPEAGESLLGVALKTPARGEVTGLASAWYITQGSTTPVTLVAQGSQWTYLDTGGNAGSAWRSLGYDDSTWSNNVAQLGFGDGDEQTPIRRVGTNSQNSVTFYFRQKFVVNDPAAFANLSMWLRRDDGGVVYLNGAEVFRSDSMPPAPFVITYQTLATNFNGGAAPPDNTIDQATLSVGSLQASTNIVAVEIHQQALSSSDLSFDFSLTGNPAPPLARVYLWTLGDQGLLIWGDPAYGLEEADQVTGPWNPVPGAVSPVLVNLKDGTKFYRLHR